MNEFHHIVSHALGSQSPSRLWAHATERQLFGYERCKFKSDRLMEAYADYSRKAECQTAYLDWVFLDAMMYSVIYELIDNIHDDVLKPTDTGNWLPHVHRAFANSSDADKSNPIWNEVKLAVMIGFFRWLATLVLLALGVGCFFIGDGWPTLGWTVLGLLALRRLYRFVRWVARMGLRRRAWKMVNALTDGYALLAGAAVPMREVRQAVESARDVFGRSAIFGAGFWAVLDDVGARHPVILIAAPETSRAT